LRLPHEKVRIFALARELGMESKDLLTICRQLGIDAKNQLSTIEPEQREQIVQSLQRRGSAPVQPQATQAKAPVTTAVLDTRVRTLDSRRPPQAPRTAPSAAPQPVQAEVQAPPPPAPPEVKPSAPAAKAAEPPPAPLPPPPPTLPAASERRPEAAKPPTPVAQPAPPAVPEQPAARATPAPQAPPAPPPPAAPPARAAEAAPPRAPAAAAPSAPGPGQPIPPSRGGGPPPVIQPPPSERVPDLGRTADGGKPRPRPAPGGRSSGYTVSSRAGTASPVAPKPLKEQGTKRPEEKKPPRKDTAVRIGDIPAELQNRGGAISIHDILKTQQQPPGAARPGQVTVPVDEGEGEDEEGRKGGPKQRIGTSVIGREKRHKDRAERQAAAKKKGGEPELRTVRTVGGVVVEDERERIRTRGRDRLKKLKKQHTQPRKGKVPIQLPITVRSLSEALGVRANDLLAKLMAQGKLVTINATLEADLAEVLALDAGCELDIKRQLDAEDRLLAEAGQPDKPEDLVPRAPIVTIMGHVDHGKTSLLDRIRKSNVVATEAGGITQVLRAWRVQHNDHWITFLDTPGHEAFTKMRARGANVTDIAVIVVAADDGVMPQTEEAINHAKAAEVDIVVAINKIDLPNANVRRTEQQLYGLGLLPDNMGGDVPFVYTSAAKGEGIDELLEQITVVAELAELKANPNKPATGTVLEAYLSGEEGVLATLLVQEGTLHPGDAVVCGASYGRVRAMYDDHGQPIEEAGPSVPVRITGLDEVPNADDPFLTVPDLAVAREIAEKRKARQHEAAQTARKPVSLESLTEQEIAELKVILKAEARGSIEAIRKELEKLHHEEVRVRILHAAIGGITESDVQLALTSPADTIIVGFNAVPDERARALAEERGIQIRQYNIIYQLTDDVRAALEGKLKPREEVIHLGRAVIRKTFKISRVGTIAGCYVTQGVIERSAKVRVIRNGVVVYPPADRSVGLESLKRVKDDAREVREGFECGLKVAGYDDVKVDDVIECYRIEQVQRTLS
jgi:translation initiation factor IF-2